MTKKVIATKGKEAYERLKKYFPRSRQLDLLTLKGHLLIEEKIEAIIFGLMKDPEQLKDADFTFDQKLKLAKALCGAMPYWSAIKLLNGIRNGYAHNIEPPKIEEKIDSFIALVFKGEKIKKIYPKDRWRIYKHTLTYIYAFITGVAQSAEIGPRVIYPRSTTITPQIKE